MRDFDEKEIAHAMLRTELSEEETVLILREFGRGRGDVDDIIDAWEDDPGY